MRVGSRQVVANYQNQLNRSYEHQSHLMEQSDGQSLHRPSDDAIGYSKYVRYETSNAENVQFQANVDTARSWMRSSDSALVGITDILMSLKQRTTAAAMSTDANSDANAIATDMLAQLQQVVSLANTQQGDRYLFSGQSDLTQPFQISSTDAPLATRGVAKTLDDKQTDFFNGNGVQVQNTGGDLYQMLSLVGSDGNHYYLNTQTGDVYSEDFLNNGYKTIIAGGRRTVNPAQDRVASIATPPNPNPNNTPAINVSTYFENTGQIRTAGTNWNQQITVNGQQVTLTFDTIQQNIATYSGDFKYISMTKQNGPIDPTSDTVNLTASDIFGTDIFDNAASGNTVSGTAVINDMLTVQAKTRANDVRWLTSDGMTLADNAHATVINGEGKMAARHNVYNAVSDILDTQNTIITQDISDVSATDVAKLSIQLMEASTVYNMSLSVGARILPPSLADYLS